MKIAFVSTQRGDQILSFSLVFIFLTAAISEWHSDAISNAHSDAQKKYMKEMNLLRLIRSRNC